MTVPDPQSLTTQCMTLLQAPQGAQRLKDAALLGAQAAEHNHDIDDIVSAMLHAASQTWSDRTAASGETAAAVHTHAAGDGMGAGEEGLHRAHPGPATPAVSL